MAFDMPDATPQGVCTQIVTQGAAQRKEVTVTDTTSYWRAHLVDARWFQGKGLPVRDIVVSPLPWYTADGDAMVRSELASVLVGDTEETYHLLVGYLPPGRGEPTALVGQAELPGLGRRDVVDVPQSPKAMAAFLEAITRPGAAGVTWLETPPSPDAPTRVFPGEQSNTTVRIGDDVLFKMFRKVNPGPDIEAQMMAALAGSGIAPRLLGTLQAPGGSYELGLFSQRIKDAMDGWAYCVDACLAGRLVDDEMAALGVALRRLHEALAAAFGTATVDGAEITSQMLDRLEAASQQAPELDALKVPLARALDLTGSTLETQRVHGDFHLGQALIAPDGWTIIDFEGEPLKSPAERAAPDTVWRDVAGLLRSLDYARHRHPEPEGDQAVHWYRSARRAFQDGYLGGTPLPEATCTAYEVDKAIYELVYEVRNRPTWAGIPRDAIRTAISG